ncbi:NADPH-cytochrome P450 reductase [Venturia nashicola]|nr:NADPH-cytochrome P450 reductase [Venturia nashicola]
MPTSTNPPERIQKVCTVWTHDVDFSTEDVVFNFDRFAELKLSPKSLAQIIPIPQGSTVKDFVRSGKREKEKTPASLTNPSKKPSLNPLAPKESAVSTFDENGLPLTGVIETDADRAYVFFAKDTTPAMKQKYPTLQISISSSIASVFGYRNRSHVLISTAEEEEHSASHVELTFRDEYLARGDMWRLAISELSGRSLYKDQKLIFLGTIKATVNAVWIGEKKRRTGYFAATTKPVFRSESARYVLFIQMSKEMWDFDAEGGGEIMFNKVINGFLPELFKKWMSINAHHLVSIILFARLEYTGEPNQSPISDSIRQPAIAFRDGIQDFYRVVVSDMASNDWINILYNLKREFRGFKKEVSLFREKLNPPQSDHEVKFTISGKISEAAKGNILQAINLACSQFSRDYVDRDLVRTGISIIVITAGTGIFEVDYDMLKLTTDNLMGSGIGIDLVCLSPMPLHSTPLFMFKYPRVLESTLPTAQPSPENSLGGPTPKQHEHMLRRLASSTSTLKDGSLSSDPQPGETAYAMPHWVDISFWNGAVEEQAMYMRRRPTTTPTSQDFNGSSDGDFHPRVKLYELQMMGLMENEMENMEIPKLHEHPLHPWPRLRHRISGRAITDESRSSIGEEEVKWMRAYDDYTFLPPQEKHAMELEAKKRNEKAAADASRLTTDAAKRSDRSYNAPIMAQTGSFRPGSGYLDWKLQEKGNVAATPPIMERRKSTVSLASNATAETSVSRTSKLSRQFSGTGPPKWAPPKPVATIDMALSAVAFKGPTFLKDGGQESPLPKNGGAIKYSQHFKAALTRSASQASTPILESPAEDTTNSLSRPIDIGSTRPILKHSRDSSKELVPCSVETVKDISRDSDSGTGKGKERNTTGLSHLRKNIPYLSSSLEEQTIPQTLSLTRAISPWLVLVNPCNPMKNGDGRKKMGRWQHLYPRQEREGAMKWKSLCSPASVPLTSDYFPTAKELTTEFNESLYHLTQDADDELMENPKAREGLIRELIAFRLSHGFQLIIGDQVADFLGNKSVDLAHIFEKSYMARDGATVFMAVGNTIHQLLCGSDGKVEIRRFNRKPTAEYESRDAGHTVAYQPLIKTFLAKNYEPRNLIFKNLQPHYNWNLIDNFIAGYSDEFTDVLRYWRARFVLIPVDIPPRTRANQRGGPGLSMVTEDSEEEIRLEGIRKFTQLLQSKRVLPSEERALPLGLRKKDPNPLAIEYQTRDPSVVIAAGVDSALFADPEGSTILESDEQTHTTKSYDLQRLAQELQSEKGIKMLDRRWHLFLHYNCFTGSDLTSWLLATFVDIQTRKNAVEFGNKLMEEGLFQHVKKKHQFRDGNFFFQVAQEYRAARPGSGLSQWFGGRTGMRSVPSTPMTEAPRSSSNASRRPGSRPSTGSSGQRTEKSATQPERRRVYLSKSMRYDVDPRKKSYRPEIINLHYDRLHNPDNCYHVRIDWMNVTSKFIEDAITYWAQSIERYGLRLVELPLSEASAITEDDPFRSPYLVKLCLPPPSSPSAEFYDVDSFTPHVTADKFRFHKLLLKKLGFVLDIEAKGNFPEDVDVMYSWGKPDYRYTQYIHNTGLVLLQITEEGEFLLLANRLYNDRTSGRRGMNRVDLTDKNFDSRIIGRNVGGNKAEFFTSPVVKAKENPAELSINDVVKSLRPKTAEEVKEEVEGFCSDAWLLRCFYLEAGKPRVVEPSPQVGVKAMSESVPELMLPAKR